jgi:hypothetical protein
VTEANDSRESLGERKDGGEVEGICVVKEDLLLGGERDERSPWAACDAGDGTRASGANNGLQEAIFGHGRRSFGLILDGGESDGGAGILFSDHVAGFFRSAGGDPLTNLLDLGVREFVAALGHVGFLGVDENLVEDAFVGFAEFYDLAVIATVHGAIVGREVEAGLMFVCVVAVEATALEDGAYGLLVGDNGARRKGEEEESPTQRHKDARRCFTEKHLLVAQ